VEMLLEIELATNARRDGRGGAGLFALPTAPQPVSSRRRIKIEQATAIFSTLTRSFA